MTTKDEALKQALEALEQIQSAMPFPSAINAIKMCREALAQKDEQEPKGVVYAYRRKGIDDFCTCDERRFKELSEKPNLFETAVFHTAPPKRQPLTDEQIKGLIEEGVFFGNCKEIVRAIEAAHGIGVEYDTP